MSAASIGLRDLRAPLLATALAACVFDAGCRPNTASSNAAIPSADATPQAWKEAAGRATSGDYPIFWKAGLEIDDPAKRENALAIMCAYWMVKNPLGFNAVFDGWPRDDARWSRVLPAMQKALPLANDRVGKDPALVELFSRMSGALAKKDPVAAKDWAIDSLGRAGRDVALAVIVEELALVAPDRATSAVDVIYDPVIQIDALRGIGRSLGRAKPEAALAWAQSLPAEKREDAKRAAIEGWADVKPEAALAWATRENDAAAVSAIFSTWAWKAPGAAALAADTLSDQALREAAHASAFEVCDRSVPVDASARDWAMRLPAGRGRDALAALLADGLVIRDPGEAWKCAKAIGDEKSRADAMRAVIGAVAADDPDIARKLIDGDTKLPANEAAELRGLIASPPPEK